MNERAPEPGDDIIGKRVVKRTIARYTGILQRVTTWLQRERPHCIENGRIKLPLTPSDYKAIQTYVSIKRDKTGEILSPIQCNGFSTINGCQSALLFYYSERGQELTPELRQTMSSK